MFVGGAIILAILAERFERKSKSLAYLLKGAAYAVGGIFILFVLYSFKHLGTSQTPWQLILRAPLWRV